MKFETLMLHGFFAASLLVCLLTLGAMLTSPMNGPDAVASHVPAPVAANPAG